MLTMVEVQTTRNQRRTTGVDARELIVQEDIDCISR